MSEKMILPHNETQEIDDEYDEYEIDEYENDEYEIGSMERESIALDDDEVDLDDSDEGNEDEDISTEEDTLSDGRRKRQTDLTSHTQDGVPIFDRGYGVSLNRTEGLRVYQSFLDRSGGRRENMDASNQATTDTPLQRQPNNSVWRGRKDKLGRHQQSPPASSNGDDYANTEKESAYRSGPSRSPTRSGTASSVEFRQSRVKPSSNGSSPQNNLQSEDHKVWSSPAGAEVVPAGNPIVGNSINISDERINAATAPAVLTQSATAFARARQQQNGSNQNVFKVTQPALISRYSSQVTAEAENLASRPSTSSNNSPPSNKKRVNKKQLRDLNHIATAAHLVADIRNSSTINMENEGN